MMSKDHFLHCSVKLPLSRQSSILTRVQQPIILRYIGNKEADKAAKEASSQVGKPIAVAQEKAREIAGGPCLINWDRSENPTPFDTSMLPGQYTWRMDQALPEKHILQLYGSLTLDQTLILIQAKTGYCWLNQYLSQAGIVYKAKY